MRTHPLSDSSESLKQVLVDNSGKRGLTVRHTVAWLSRAPLTAPPPMGTLREISLLSARGLPLMEML